MLDLVAMIQLVPKGWGYSLSYNPARERDKYCVTLSTINSLLAYRSCADSLEVAFERVLLAQKTKAESAHLIGEAIKDD